MTPLAEAKFRELRERFRGASEKWPTLRCALTNIRTSDGEIELRFGPCFVMNYHPVSDDRWKAWIFDYQIALQIDPRIDPPEKPSVAKEVLDFDRAGCDTFCEIASQAAWLVHSLKLGPKNVIRTTFSLECDGGDWLFVLFWLAWDAPAGSLLRASAQRGWDDMMALFLGQPLPAPSAALFHDNPDADQFLSVIPLDVFSASVEAIDLMLLLPDEPAQPADESEDDETPPRPAYARDHLFLEWYGAAGTATYHSHANIRDKWNAMSLDQRKDVSPLCSGKLAGGTKGRDTVNKAITQARKDKSEKST